MKSYRIVFENSGIIVNSIIVQCDGYTAALVRANDLARAAGQHVRSVVEVVRGST